VMSETTFVYRSDEGEWAAREGKQS